MPQEPHYCSRQEAADHAVLDLGLIQDWWLRDIDALIESHMGYGYKGRTQTVTVFSAGGRYLKLPRLAAAVTSITDEYDTVSTVDEYVLEPRGRIVRRKAGRWYGNHSYTVVLTEPALTEVPHEWHLCAVACVAHIAMFIEKYREYGVALTASDAGQAGRVSTAASTSFPASLEEELKRKIQTLLKRPII